MKPYPLKSLEALLESLVLFRMDNNTKVEQAKCRRWLRIIESETTRSRRNRRSR